MPPAHPITWLCSSAQLLFFFLSDSLPDTPAVSEQAAGEHGLGDLWESLTEVPENRKRPAFKIRFTCHWLQNKRSGKCMIVAWVSWVGWCDLDEGLLNVVVFYCSHFHLTFLDFGCFETQDTNGRRRGGLGVFGKGQKMETHARNVAVQVVKPCCPYV